MRCEKCGRTFGRREDLSRHRCVQTECGWCGKAMSLAPNRLVRAKVVFCGTDCRAKWLSVTKKLPRVERVEKRCPSCGMTRPAKDFPKCSERRDGLQAYCRQCHAARYRRDRKKRRAQGRAAYERDRESGKERARQWARANPERRREISRRYDASHREQNRRREREWALENRERRNATQRRRRARKVGARGRASPEEVEQRIAMFGGRCYICGKSYEGVDHVKPLAVGGPDYPANLRPICRRCNSVKNDQWPLSLSELRQMIGVS